jgi:hypothetical protein
MIHAVGGECDAGSHDDDSSSAHFSPVKLSAHPGPNYTLIQHSTLELEGFGWATTTVSVSLPGLFAVSG